MLPPSGVLFRAPLFAARKVPAALLLAEGRKFLPETPAPRDSGFFLSESRSAPYTFIEGNPCNLRTHGVAVHRATTLIIFFVSPARKRRMFSSTMGKARSRYPSKKPAR